MFEGPLRRIYKVRFQGKTFTPVRQVPRNSEKPEIRPWKEYEPMHGLPGSYAQGGKGLHGDDRRRFPDHGRGGRPETNEPEEGVLPDGR